MSRSIAAILLLIAASTIHASEILLDEDFNGTLSTAALQLSTTPESLLLISLADDQRAGGERSTGSNSQVLRIHEHPERDRETQIGAGYKPATDIPLKTPGDSPKEIMLSFDFKQMSGDTSGLALDLLDMSKGYSSWIRVTIGLEEIKVMRGKTTKTSALPNGPDSDWHHIKVTVPYPGSSAQKFNLSIDGDNVIEAASFGSLGKPQKLTHIRFSDNGLGPNYYYIDNVKISTP